MGSPRVGRNSENRSMIIYRNFPHAWGRYFQRYSTFCLNRWLYSVSHCLFCYTPL